MRRFEFPGLIPLLIAFSFAGFAGFSGCTGTSTESENTLGLVPGRALRAGGSPASKARITLRSREVVADGFHLEWRVLDTATADQQGRFELRLPESVEVFLEIREADSAVPHPQTHFTRYDSAAIRPRRFGDLVLAPSGTLEGRLTPRPGAPNANLWLGVAGTSVLVKLPGTADSTGLPFRLEGLPAGEHTLSVVAQGGVTSSPPPANPPPRANVAADTVTDAGQVYFEEAQRVLMPRSP